MKYFISFIEEGIFNPKYFDYAGGRMEVYLETEQYNIDEIRFFTKRNKSWNDFRDKYDFKDVSKALLSKITKEIQTKYYKPPK